MTIPSTSESTDNNCDPVPEAQAIVNNESWDIPPASSFAPGDLEAIINAVLAIRLAGVQYRLYPSTSDMTRDAVSAAMAALEALFITRPSLIITFDGHTIAFDGQIIQRRDLQVVMKDFHQWMSEGNIRAIGITAKTREFELAQFLHAMATYEPKEGQATFLDTVAQLNLINIKVLTRSLQSDQVQTHRLDVDWTKQDAGFSPVPSLTELNMRPDDPVNDASSAWTHPAQLDEASWARLPEALRESAATDRRNLMERLAHWLMDEEHRPDQSLTELIDTLLIDLLHREDDRQVMQDTLTAVEMRLQQLRELGDWDGMYAILEPLYARLAENSPLEIARYQLEAMLDRIGENIVIPGLLAQLTENPHELKRAQKVVTLLGVRVIRPIIATLKIAVVMQERIQLLQLLREFGAGQQSLFLDELREPNPWYVYRNLLVVLSEIGTEEALATIGEKIGYSDPRVRMEAVAAATRIARGRGVAYLAQGLEDHSASVRACAAALISLCPEPRILEITLRLLQPRLGKEEPDSVQLNACLGLGYFRRDAARETLLQILHPSLWSAYRKKSETVRAAAVTALEQHLPHSAAEAAIKRATTDKCAAVRQIAQRIWAQWEDRKRSELSA